MRRLLVVPCTGCSRVGFLTTRSYFAKPTTVNPYLLRIGENRYQPCWEGGLSSHTSLFRIISHGIMAGTKPDVAGRSDFPLFPSCIPSPYGTRASLVLFPRHITGRTPTRSWAEAIYNQEPAAHRLSWTATPAELAFHESLWIYQPPPSSISVKTNAPRIVIGTAISKNRSHSWQGTPMSSTHTAGRPRKRATVPNG